jgi:LysM repeat protein
MPFWAAALTISAGKACHVPTTPITRCVNLKRARTLTKEATMSDQRLEQLKSKYQSVLNLMNQLGVQLQNLHLQDNKLVLRCLAKTKADSDKVWDQIKLVDKGYQQDLMAEIGYAAEASAAAAAAAQSAPRTYTIRAGDTLSRIAKEHYGDPKQYMKIFEANPDQLSDPDKIQPGQTLIIP